MCVFMCARGSVCSCVHVHALVCIWTRAFTGIDLERNYQDKTRTSKDGMKKPADTQGAGKKAAQPETLSENSLL